MFESLKCHFNCHLFCFKRSKYTRVESLVEFLVESRVKFLVNCQKMWHPSCTNLFHTYFFIQSIFNLFFRDAYGVSYSWTDWIVCGVLQCSNNLRHGLSWRLVRPDLKRVANIFFLWKVKVIHPYTFLTTLDEFLSVLNHAKQGI